MEITKICERCGIEIDINAENCSNCKSEAIIITIYTLTAEDGETVVCKDLIKKIDPKETIKIEGLYLPYFYKYLNISEKIGNEIMRANMELELFEKGFRKFQWQNKIIGKSAKEDFDKLPQKNIGYRLTFISLCLMFLFGIIGWTFSDKLGGFLILAFILFFATICAGTYGEIIDKEKTDYTKKKEIEPDILIEIKHLTDKIKTQIVSSFF